METTNVERNQKNVTTNMIVTYPGEKGIEIVTKGESINIRDYIKEVGALSIAKLSHTEKEIRAYLAKYDPEKLKEYDAKKLKEKNANIENKNKEDDERA